MKLILLTACVLLLGNSFAQNYVTIPDANFAKYLKEVIPNAMNGDQLDTSSSDVKNLKKIDAEARAIKNLDGVQYFTGLDTLDVGNGEFVPNESKNVISTLPELPENLKVLVCGKTSLDSLPELPKSLKILYCYDNQLTSLPQLPNSLQILHCNYNQLSSLPQLPNSLQELRCFYNQLTSLPELPNSLQLLSCSNNQLSSLPQLPNSLQLLSCSNNQLSSLPQLPNSLQELYCDNNQLSSLPQLPNSLQELYCYNNQLSSLPQLPNSLQKLYCYNNQLSSLTELPNSLQWLDCSYNQLSSLSKLPNSLQWLDCSYNQLSSLSKLPNSLQLLSCSNNQLSSLPQLPNSLYWLDCSYNQLSSLPQLPNSLYKLDCHSNKINCFPILPSSLSDKEYFNISNNPFTCIPNYVPAMDNNILSYPLCDKNDTINNPHGCPNAANGILGFTSFDTNKNCHKDTLEAPLANIPMVLLDSANNLVSQTYTAINGVYQFPVGANHYKVQIDTTNLPFSALCPKGGDTTIILSDSSIFAKDVNFNLTCKDGFDVGIRSVATTGIVFPGQAHNLYVTAGDMSNWYGRHCAEGISGQLQLTVTGPVKYVATTGTKTPSINGNVYTYEIADFGNVNFSEDFGLSFVTDTTAKADDQICVNAQITPKNGDYNVANNTYDYCYSVINSHDPNLKEVYPANFKPGYDGYLTYTVHFQNTGSAQAFNIRLADTLDAKLDLKTFEVLNYSHVNTVSLTGNVMRVKYPNIMLSDSTTNEKASHGFIQYRIKPLAPISEEQQIKNTAYIYFDYNDAIVTNTTVSKANKSLGIHEEKELGLRVYPNPMENLLTFERTSHIINSVNVSIVSVNGQVLYTNKMDLTNKQTIDLTDFSPGVYFVNVQNEEATDVIKVIKK